MEFEEGLRTTVDWYLANERNCFVLSQALSMGTLLEEWLS